MEGFPTIKSSTIQSVKLKSIYDYIDIKGVRQFLVYYPRLLLMLEILLSHIDDYIHNQTMQGKMPLDKSSLFNIFKVISTRVYVRVKAVWRNWTAHPDF